MNNGISIFLLEEVIIGVSPFTDVITIYLSDEPLCFMVIPFPTLYFPLLDIVYILA